MKRLFSILLIIVGLSSISKGQINLSVFGAASIPSGNFSDYYSTAFGFRGNISYSTSNDVQFFLHSGYNVWKFNNDKYNDAFHSSGGVGTFNLEIPITAIPLLLGTRFSLTYRRYTKVYAEVAGGFYLITTNASGKYSDNTGTYDLGFEKKNYTEFTVHIGGGTIFPLYKKLNIDAGVFFDLITDSEAAKQAKSSKNAKDYYDASTVKTFVFCLGLNYQF